MSVNLVMRIFFIFFIILILNIQNLYAAGKGELKLDKSTMEHFISYLYGGGSANLSDSKNKVSKPMVFTVSKDGRMSHYFFCPYIEGCRYDPGIPARSIKSCEKYSNGSPCKVFAKKRTIRWKNGGPKVKFKNKDFKSPYVIAKKIQEGGFYDGNIDLLAGIDMKTGRIDDTITILGEKVDSSTQNSSDDSSDIVKQLENLKKLLEQGALSEEEFNIAKTKLLNQ